ncbi:MAG: ergothioneine biosynthesis protein EgtB [Alphaproteobacteria bacterium]|nr:ergothioneine biosynthesis protein EgtB [Alphaproteobacteria bacterium]MBV9371934.1 ergothioneine biosynthesis protein EgtB [Alphaproteobacteria bacterium]MBV9900421.1 ergothioneine biosynthesis protein EgtB [Alphaproteobacteria bacterium]
MASQADYPRSDVLAERYGAVRDLSLGLAAPLSDADATLQPHADASPAKWHLAHTTWFFETFVLRDHVPAYAARDESWAYLFNSYYEGEGERHPRPRRGLLSRPSLDQIRAWRARVDEAVVRALPGLAPDALRRLELGLHHEQQHQELILTDMLAAFAENPLHPAVWPAAPSAPAPAPTAIGGLQRPGGVYEVGAPDAGFAFDCERPRHAVLLAPHELADRLVTNGEWLRFIEEGGYATAGLWLSDGWAWVRENGIEAPLYWRRGEGAWLRFGLDGLRPVEQSEPVCHISYYEADAFARWAGARLPREEEWEAAAAAFDPASGHQLDAPGPARPRPAPEGRGLRQLYGDAWEWCQSAYLPYPGFRPEEGIVGEYNGKFMVNQMVLRGGSCATPRGHMRPSYRNFFYPHQRWQYCGLRLARDL